MNSDNSVKKLKGSFRPIINQFERSSILSSFEFIDKIVIFEENTPINLIKKLNQNLFLKAMITKQVRLLEIRRSKNGEVQLF